MKDSSTRRTFLWAMTSALSLLTFRANGQSVSPPPPREQRGKRTRRQVDYVLPPELSLYALLSVVLGRISDRSVTISLLAAESMDIFVEYGPGVYARKTQPMPLAAGNAAEILLDGLQADTEYVYRVQIRKAGEGTYSARPECRFHTQRRSGRTFVFAIQGDSHPERPQMSEPNLYARTLLKAAEDHPDFYICMGDDFSADPVANVTEKTIAERYTLHR